jgi:hypothetical protein
LRIFTRSNFPDEKISRTLSEPQVKQIIISEADDLKSTARRISRETAKTVNRHLESNDRFAEKKIEEVADDWFDGLDHKDITVIQRVFPGKELLAKVLEKLNDGQEKTISTGRLIASLEEGLVPSDMKTLLQSASDASLSS